MERFLRNKTFISSTSFFIVLLSLTTYFSIVQNNKQIKSQQDAHNHTRAQWDELDSKNAHSAAHYGTYVFKSNTILNSLDDGINSVTGVVLRLEGHKQNDVAFRSISIIEVSKFGKFKTFPDFSVYHSIILNLFDI